MIGSRFVSRLSKHLTASITPWFRGPDWCVLKTPCSYITTNRDHARCGNGGADPTRALEHFLGKWVLVKKEVHGKVPEGVELSGNQFYGHFYKEYSRLNGKWRLSIGLLGEKYKIDEFEFVLGETLTRPGPDGEIMKIRIYQDGEKLKWENSFPDGDIVIYITNEIKDGFLYWTTKYPEGLTTIRKYEKSRK